MLKSQSTSEKNIRASDVECLDTYDEDNNDNEGFTEGDIHAGKVLATFNFETSETSGNPKASSIQFPAQQCQTYTSSPRGLTPPIDGENFTVKRSYTMRPSTVKKLNTLKAEHPDVNILFNTIVDMAISHYYNYIFNESGTFDNQEDKNKTS